MAVKIKKKQIKKNTKARPGTKLGSFLGVTIHNTGNASKGADALAHAKYLANSTNKSVSYHYVVDEKIAYNVVPTSEVAYHAGDSTGNNRTIGIEICMNKDGNLKKATDNGAYIAAKLLFNRGAKTAASGKNIYQHHDWSGKDCPQMIRDGKPYSWKAFVKKVNAYLDAMWYPTLTVGKKHPIVSKLKKALDKKGYRGIGGKRIYPGNDTYGLHTAHAVKAFKKANGLPANGKAGKQTFKALGL